MTATDDGVTVLMRALPRDLADRVLARLKPPTAERLRDKLTASAPEAPESLERALREFADIQRIADRVTATASTPASSPTEAPPLSQLSPDDPMQQLRNVAADSLLTVLRGEQPALVANVLSCLEAPAAAELLKRLPATMRPPVTLKLSQPQTTNHNLLAPSRAGRCCPQRR